MELSTLIPLGVLAALIVGFVIWRGRKPSRKQRLDDFKESMRGKEGWGE